MNSTSLRGIIIGYGNMGRVHRAAAEHLGVRVGAIIDTDPEITREQTSPPVYANVASAPAELAPEFAVIATPTDQHLDTLREVLSRFPSLKGVLLEKPPVRTTTEVADLRKISVKSSAIFVGEVEQYNAQLQDFFSWNGRPILIKFNRQVNLEYFLHGAQPWFLDERRSGGIVLDMMIHDLNLIVAKYGLPVEIEDVKSERRHYEIDDNVTARLRYEGFSVEIVGSWTSPDQDQPIKAKIEITDDTGKVTTVSCRNYIESLLPEENPYYRQMEAFMTTVQSGRLPYSLDQYLDATELALTIADRTI